MSQTVFGQTSWDSSPSSGSRDDFLNLNRDGQYTLRILSEPFSYSVHWVENAGKEVRKVNCAGRGCLLCKEAAAGVVGSAKAQVRYLLEVLNRDTGKCQMVEFGPQVFSGIKKLVSNKHWGDPKTYDIVIDRNKANSPNVYAVMPVGKTELTLEDRAAIKEFMERMDLSVFTQPSTNEQILKKLGREEGAASTEGASASAGAKPATASAFDF